MNDMNVKNWLTAPINKRSFQNIESLFDSIRIKRGTRLTSIIDSIKLQPIFSRNKKFESLDGENYQFELNEFLKYVEQEVGVFTIASKSKDSFEQS